MNRAILLFISALICDQSYSQTTEQSKRTIGVMQFSAADNGNIQRAAELQQIALEEFASKKHIIAIDRSTDDVLNKELAIQKSGEVINASVLVEQGKKLGAQDMITGRVSSVDAEMKKSGGYNALTRTSTPETVTYNGKVSFSIQVVDVETGVVKASKSFDLSNSSNSFLGIPLQVYNSREDAMNSVIKANKKQIMKLMDNWVNVQYPPLIKVYDVVTRDKKGFPETVRVIGLTDANPKKGTELIMQDYEELTVEGKKMISSKDFGMLRVKELNGDFILCQVSKGEEMMEGKMNDKRLRLIIKDKN